MDGSRSLASWVWPSSLSIYYCVPWRDASSWECASCAWHCTLWSQAKPTWVLSCSTSGWFCYVHCPWFNSAVLRLRIMHDLLLSDRSMVFRSSTSNSSPSFGPIMSSSMPFWSSCCWHPFTWLANPRTKQPIRKPCEIDWKPEEDRRRKKLVRVNGTFNKLSLVVLIAYENEDKCLCDQYSYCH